MLLQFYTKKRIFSIS